MKIAPANIAVTRIAAIVPFKVARNTHARPASVTLTVDREVNIDADAPHVGYKATIALYRQGSHADSYWTFTMTHACARYAFDSISAAGTERSVAEAVTCSIASACEVVTGTPADYEAKWQECWSALAAHFDLPNPIEIIRA